jgi:mannonate dehydratase
MTETMRIALGQFNEMTTERLTYAKQIGVSGVQMNMPRLPDEDGYWKYEDLKRLTDRCDEFGLKLEALENTPRHFYLKAMLGLPGRDEQIENYQRTIRNMAQAGIPTLGYNWMPNWVWRTPNKIGRGGVQVTAFSMDEVDSDEPLIAGLRELPELEGRTIDHDTMWENYRYFTSAVLPVAEEVGMKLALHPDDPPVPTLGGIARLFYNSDGYKKAFEEIAPSPNHGMDLCLGCFSEMGENVLDVIRYFGERKRIFYVHFRDVQGCVPTFQECFLGEGNYNPVKAMMALKSVGFTGFIIDDHVPKMIDDSHWNHRGHAHATGYLLGMLAAVEEFA